MKTLTNHMAPRNLMIIGLMMILNLSFGVQTQAQNNESVQGRLNQLKANKIAFLTQQLQLTPEEAQVFWPVYNEFGTKKEELNKKTKELTKQIINNQHDLTDSQKEKVADAIIATRVEVANLEAEYHNKFKAVLPISKVLKLYQSENQFKSELVRQLKEQQIKTQEKNQIKRKD